VPGKAWHFTIVGAENKNAAGQTGGAFALPLDAA
jgi:hypothetical protein